MRKIIYGVPPAALALFVGVSVSAGCACAAGGLSAEGMQSAASALTNAAWATQLLLALCVCALSAARAGADAQKSRAALGALRALGCSPSTLCARLPLPLLAPALIASAAGLLCARFVAAPLIASAYGARAAFSLLSALLALIPVVFAYACACLVYRVAIMTKPVELMDESRCEMSGIGGGTRGLSAFTLIRHAWFHYKRALVCALCACLCAALCVVGANVCVSAARAQRAHLDNVEMYDRVALANENTQNMPDAAPARVKEASASAREASVAARLICVSPPQNLINLVAADTGEALDIPAHGALITRRMAETLNLTPGDTFDINGGETTLTVRQVIEGYIGNLIVLGERYYEEAFGAPPELNAYLINGQYSNTEDTEAGEITYIHIDHIIRQSAPEFFALLKLAPYAGAFIILLGALCALALNTTLITRLRERRSALCMLRASGYTPRAAARLFLCDSLVVTIIGSALGVLVSSRAYYLVARAFEATSVQLMRQADPTAFIIGALTALALTAIALWLTAHAAKRVPLTDADAATY